jgi:hypothetical protein
MVANPYLKTAVETLLKVANPNCEPYFGVTAFHKMIFLLYQRLKKKKIDIKLPYSWYRYGPFVNAIEFERQVGVPLSDYIPEDGPVCLVTEITHDGVPLEDVGTMEQEAQVLVRKCKPRDQYIKGYLDPLLDDAYTYAPFKFQKLFNRGFLVALGQFKSYCISKEEIEYYLDNLVKTYPYKEMEELSDTFLEWDDTARLSINYSSPSKTYNLAENFWFIYSDLLQINRYENISEDITQQWLFEFPEKLNEYNRQLRRDRKVLLRTYREKCSQDTEILKIVGKMNDLAYGLAMKDKIKKGA